MLSLNELMYQRHAFSPRRQTATVGASPQKTQPSHTTRPILAHLHKSRAIVTHNAWHFLQAPGRSHLDRYQTAQSAVQELVSAMPEKRDLSPLVPALYNFDRPPEDRAVSSGKRDMLGGKNRRPHPNPLCKHASIPLNNWDQNLFCCKLENIIPDGPSACRMIRV